MKSSAVVTAYGTKRNFLNDRAAFDKLVDHLTLVDPIHAKQDCPGADIKLDGLKSNKLGQALISTICLVASMVPPGKEQCRVDNRNKWKIAYEGFDLPVGAPPKLHEIFKAIREHKVMELPPNI